tara:strand:+ start:113 stop:391 length:279 start_codon:yes stop_codon:yes gene_type:complete
LSIHASSSSFLVESLSFLPDSAIELKNDGVHCRHGNFRDSNFWMNLLENFPNRASEVLLLFKKLLGLLFWSNLVGIFGGSIGWWSSSWHLIE